MNFRFFQEVSWHPANVISVFSQSICLLKGLCHLTTRRLSCKPASFARPASIYLPSHLPLQSANYWQSYVWCCCFHLIFTHCHKAVFAFSPYLGHWISLLFSNPLLTEDGFPVKVRFWRVFGNWRSCSLSSVIQLLDSSQVSLMILGWNTFSQSTWFMTTFSCGKLALQSAKHMILFCVLIPLPRGIWSVCDAVILHLCMLTLRSARHLFIHFIAVQSYILITIWFAGPPASSSFVEMWMQNLPEPFTNNGWQ